MHAYDRGTQLVARADGVDAGELIGDRSGAARLDPRRVHAARVEPAELSDVGIVRRGGLSRGALEYPADDLVVALRELVEAAPHREGRRNGRRALPPTGRELLEVLARLARGVDIRRIDCPHRGLSAD